MFALVVSPGSKGFFERKDVTLSIFPGMLSTGAVVQDLSAVEDNSMALVTGSGIESLNYGRNNLFSSKR